ncbi:hypothetical protein CROQUDRAFT_101016 [Cronartium quercuum f. sp. fusiforme G11]|uniref:Uncharacterized protein n=1 Tax=Cronartium quercuum f. sp. fusiforme G11 TaxID=708437 RepID=A0A9P6N9Q3_9BASI|nr:hypothetical protein CROQUDRAFT_101016 [Cronartium quercuum f. sp. fusiforme G11]
MQSTEDITMDILTSTPSFDNVSEIIATALKKQASYFETIISDLQTQISSLNVKKPASPKEKQQKATSSARAYTHATPGSATTLQVSKSNSPTAASNATRKCHPLQVMVIDTPKDFKSCKEVLYVHIKMMWGLYKPSDVPPTTDAALLKEFYTQFNSAEEVESVVNNPSSTDLIAQESIMSLKELRTGGQKIARGLGHIDEIVILYISGILAKVACRITALNTFRQLLAVGTYNYMNVNLKHANSVSLMTSIYNHYVHFVMAAKYKMEQNNASKVKKQCTQKTIQKNRERELPPMQKQLIANAENVAFLPDASQSLLPTHHPDEQLGDAKFTTKYLDVFLEVYDLSDDEGKGFEDSDEKEDFDQSDESLDSDVEGEEEDKEESEFYEEGEYGDLYDNEATESGDDNE